MDDMPFTRSSFADMLEKMNPECGKCHVLASWMRFVVFCVVWLPYAETCENGAILHSRNE